MAPGRCDASTYWLGCAGLVLRLLLLAQPVSGQDVQRFGLRAGGGLDTSGGLVFSGQIEVMDVGASASAALAVGAFGRHSRSEDYETVGTSRSDQYHEETRVWGVGVLGSYLFRHGSQVAGPYLVLGLGLAPLFVEWRLESGTDDLLGTQDPSGGSFDEERRVTLGSVLNLAIGRRVGDRFDVRAEVQTIVVPSTERREDVKLMSALLLTTGMRF